MYASPEADPLSRPTAREGSAAPIGVQPTPRRARGLRSELAVVIVLAMVPLIAFSVGAVLWGAWLQQRSVQSGLENTASALSLAVSRELEGWKATLRAVAVSAELESGDFAGLQQRVAPLAQAMGGWVVLFTPDGRQLMNTLVPYGTPLRDAASKAQILSVVARQESTASDLFRGNNAQRNIVVVYEPVIEDGVVRYVLGLAVDPVRLSRLLAVQPLPPRWYSIVTDGSDRVIARSLRSDDYVGHDAPAWFTERTGRRGILHGTALDGVAVLAAYETLAGVPWTLSVAVPESLIDRDRRAVLLALGVGALALLALAVWLSGRVANRIETPVRALAQAAERGTLPAAPSASGVRELQELERALIRAADVERERSTERERRLALEAANAAKDEFLATLSHELRTPLQSALGWLHVLRMAVDDQPARDRAVPVIERNLRQLAQLVDDLIDASRIVAGKVALQVEPHDLAPLVRQTAETWLPAVAAKEQRLVVEADASVWVRCDRARVAQVLSNLIANSVKFTPRGGRIAVRLHGTSAHAEIAVQDDGTGIVPEALPKLFNKFWQVQSGSERRYQGLGLGLAIVKSLVELQGGEVRVASEGLGRGSTFIVTLPRIDPPTAAGAPTVELVPALASGIEGRRILLVDDDVDAGGAIAQLLALDGASVTLVHSVKAALQELSRQDFDAALSDIAMPEQDGFAFLRGVRRHCPQLPVIALTAFASDRDRQRALGAGFNGFLSKPVDLAQLRKALAACFAAPPAPV